MPRALNPAEIRVQIRAQIEQLRFTHPDVCDDDDLFALALASETELHEFMADIVKRMRNAETMADAQDAEIKDLAARRNRYRARYEAMRQLAFKVMQMADVKKLELVRATLSIRAGQPKVVITDESALPESCIRTKREPDKAQIRDMLLRSEPVSGASLSNAEPVLTVRVQ